MKRRIFAVILLVAMLICTLPLSVIGAEKSDDIVILYENDVHCAIEGYSVLSAMKKELSESYAHVGVVSSGDFVQGASIGSISKGEYIVELMNLVGYDAIALGNHEFDYGLERLLELCEILDTKPVSSNFMKVGEGECFAPYSIVEYGEIKIAYIGITTPETPEKTSFPTQFVDKDGNEIYTFCPDNLAEVVQKNIDAARTAGADFVIALSHLGDKEEKYNAHEVVSRVSGLDVVLDAHSHSVIESGSLTDKDGKSVVYSSTGTKFENIGRLTISGDSITTEIISLEEYTATDPLLDERIAEIEAEYAQIGNRKVAYSDFDLITHNEQEERLVRIRETNLGNLISDAFRSVLGADVAYFNGGGIRSAIKAGEITYNDLLNVLPFNNWGVVVEVDGATIVEMLELAVEKWPEESGNYPHVSGISFCVNFAEGAGNRVYNVMVESGESGEYEPLELEKKYTLASNNFILLEGGDGMDMFADAKVISDTGILDIEILEAYIVDHLGGVIDAKYANTTYHVRFTDGTGDDAGHAVWIAAVSVALMASTVAIVIIIRKKRG